MSPSGAAPASTTRSGGWVVAGVLTVAAIGGLFGLQVGAIAQLLAEETSKTWIGIGIFLGIVLGVVLGILIETARPKGRWEPILQTGFAALLGATFVGGLVGDRRRVHFPGTRSGAGGGRRHARRRPLGWPRPQKILEILNHPNTLRVAGTHVRGSVFSLVSDAAGNGNHFS
jgi:hypothetical protein